MPSPPKTRQGARADKEDVRAFRVGIVIALWAGTHAASVKVSVLNFASRAEPSRTLKGIPSHTSIAVAPEARVSNLKPDALPRRHVAS